MRYCLLLLAGCLLMGLAPAIALADGWPQRRGHGYYKLGYQMVRASELYQSDGRRMDIPTLGAYTISFYGEYGVTDRTTVLAYVPFIERITLNRQVGRETAFEFFEGDAITHIADPEVGVRVGLLQHGAAVVSASVRLGIPLGEEAQPNGLNTGDGEWNQIGALEAGYSFYPVPAYLGASVGYNNHTQGFSDEVMYALEGGYTFAGAVTIIARLRGVESLDNGDAGVRGGMGVNANNQRYLAYGAEVIYALTDTYGLSLGATSATRAQNVLAAPAFSAGVWLSL